MKIDWDELRASKEELLQVLMECYGKNQYRHDKLMGILSLLDEIQDQAVEEGIATEKEVFGDESFDCSYEERKDQ